MTHDADLLFTVLQLVPRSKHLFLLVVPDLLMARAS